AEINVFQALRQWLQAHDAQAKLCQPLDKAGVRSRQVGRAVTDSVVRYLFDGSDVGQQLHFTVERAVEAYLHIGRSQQRLLELGRAALGGNPAPVNNGNTVGQRLGLRQIVGAENDTAAILTQLGNRIPD